MNSPSHSTSRARSVTALWKVLPSGVLGQLGPVLGLVLVIVIFGLLNPRDFLTLDNFTTIFYLTAVVATAALGMTLVIVAGGIDLSVGSSIALVTVVISQFLCLLSTGRFYTMTMGQEVSSPSPMAALGAAGVGVGAAALAGLVIGLMVTRLRLAPFIVTLGMWATLRGAAKLSANEVMVRSPPTWLNTLLKSRPAEPVGEQAGIWFHVQRLASWLIHLPYAVWVTALLAILVALMLRYTRFGRHIYAIGSNESAARLCGVRVDRTKILIYTLAGAFVGIAGVFQFAFIKMGDPTTASGKELDIIAAVVVGASLSGGRGTIIGTIVGALIMSIVDNGCTNAGISNSWQQVVTGGIIILAVAVDRLRWRARE